MLERCSLDVFETPEGRWIAEVTSGVTEAKREAEEEPHNGDDSHSCKGEGISA